MTSSFARDGRAVSILSVKYSRNVIITRLEVEEGFLDKLDVTFAPGLNVIIGARGVGKSSIIELIRFALAAPSHTEKQASKATAHAKAILGGGRVILTVREGQSEFSLVRAVGDQSPRVAEFPRESRASILSQGEIEDVGVTPSGRLSLVDAFRSVSGSETERERALAAQIGSVMAEIRELASDLERLSELVRSKENVPTELATAQAEEAELLNKLGAAGPDRERLAQLTDQLGRSALRRDVIEASQKSIRLSRDRISQSLTAEIVEHWPDSAGEPDLLFRVRALTERARDSISVSIKYLDEALEESEKVARETRDAQARDEDEARTIRSRLESLQAGAGAVTRRLSDLGVQQSQLLATQSAVTDRIRRLESARRRRDAVVDQLDAAREARFVARQAVVDELNRLLGPRLRIDLQRYGQPSGYQDALLAALRGSGLQYNTLAPFLSKTVSPRELVSLVEQGDATRLAQLAHLTPDRASRVVDHLREEPLELLLTAPVEDDVELLLLDGAAYKSSNELSTGQRCTVVLPVILSHPGQVVIVDQPEDNLDNGFIVDTVVRSIKERSATAQTILATHNANIPVLGEASRVVYLGSTGQRGYVRAQADLEDPAIVEGITTVMEGGIEAFQLRAQFYNTI